MTPYRALIERTAAAHGLDADLVEAIVIAESNGCTDAFRHEPDFYRQDQANWASGAVDTTYIRGSIFFEVQ